MFARLSEKLEESSDFAGLTRLYKQRAEAVGGEEALYLMLTIAEVWASRLGDQEAVAQAYERSLVLSQALDNNGPAQVRDTLKEVFWARGDWRSLADLTEAETRQMAPGPERARHWMDLAQLRMAKLGQITHAVAAWVYASEEPGAPVHEVRQSLQGLLERHPDHPDVWGALHRVCEAHLETPDDARLLLDLLEMRLAKLDEGQDWAARQGLLIQMGQLAIEFLEDAEEGVRFIKEAHRSGAPPESLAPVLEGLLVSDELPEVLGLLRSLYRVMGQWERFVEVGHREAFQVADPVERAAILMEVALAGEEHLGDVAGACRLYEEAAGLDPSLRDLVVDRIQGILLVSPAEEAALSALKAILRDRGDDAALLELLEAEEAMARTEQRRATILVEMAALCAGSVGRPDRALECYEAAADLAGDDVEPVIEGLFGLYHQGYYLGRVERVLRALCERRGRWRALVSLLELLLEDAASPQQQAALHFELGHVLEGRLEALERAMHHFQMAFRLDVERSDYIDAGRALYRKMGNLEMVARLYDIQLKVSAGPEQAAALLLEKSQVLFEDLRDPARALEALGRACALAPEMAEAHAALEALVLGPQGVAAMSALESAYLGAGRPAEAAAIYLMVGDRLRQTVERLDPRNPQRSRALGLANDCDLRAYDLDPTGNARVRATARLEAGLAEAGRWTELAELLERRASAEADAEARQELLLRLGAVAWDKLKSMELAEAAWETVLELEPGQLRAFTSMEGMYRAAGAEDKTDDLICWALDKAPWASASAAPQRRGELFVRLASTRQARGAEADAYRAWLLLGEHDPNHAEVKAFFEARSDSPEGALDLFRLLERGMVNLTDVDLRTERLEAMARLAAEKMRDPLLAIDQHRALIGLHGAGEEARRRAVERLRELYRDIEQLDALVALLEDELAREALDPESRLGALIELVEVHEGERHDLAAACAALERLIELQPQRPEHRLRLARLWRRQGAASREVEVLSEMIALADEGLWERVSDVEGKAQRPEDLLLRLARVLTDELEDLDAALPVWRRLLGYDALRDTALGALQRVIVLQRDFEGLMALFDEQVEAARDTSDKIHYLSRMALLAEQELGDLERAVALWGRVLALRPKDPDALQALEEIHSQAGAWADLVEVCQTRLTVTADPEGRARLHRKIGRIHRQNDQLDAAREAYLALIAEIPDDVLARQALYEIYRAQENHEALVSVIEELLRYESDGQRRHDLMVEQARVAIDHQGDPSAAIAVLEKLVEEHPQDVASLERLFDLHAERKTWSRAARALGLLAEQAHDSARRIELLLKLAALYKEELRDPVQAAEILEQVLELHPANREALQRLELLYEQLDRADALVRIRTRLFGLSTDPAEQIGLLRALARVLEDDLEDRPAAFERIVQAHEIDADDPDHLDALDRLAEAAGLWPRLLEVLSADAARASSLDARHGLQARMAELVERHLGDLPGAFAIHGEIFGDEPSRGPVLAEMERLAALSPALWPEVLALYGRLVDLASDAEARVDLLWRAAQIQREGLADPKAAFETCRRAMALDARANESLALLRELAEAEGLWAELVSVGEQRWPTLDDSAARIEVLLDNARIIEAHLHDPERALEQYVLAFQLDPRHEIVEERLRALAVADAVAKEVLLKLYERAIGDHDAQDDVEGKIHFLQRIATLHEARGEGEEGFDAMARAFRVAPGRADVRAELERIGATIRRLDAVAFAYREQAEQSRREEAMIFFMASARLLSGPLNSPQDAIALLRTAMEIHPDHDEVLAQLEALYRDRGELEALVGLTVHRAERTVDRDRRYEAYLSVAELLEQSEDPERAVEYYRRALRLHPRKVEVHERLANLYERLDQPDRVARSLEQIVEIVDGEDEPRLVQVLNQLSAHYAENRRPSRALEMDLRLLELRPLRQDFFDRLEAALKDSPRLDALMEQYQRRVVAFDLLIKEVEALPEPAAAPARLLDAAGQPPSLSTLRLEQLRLLRTIVDRQVDDFNNPRAAVKALGDLLDRFSDDVEAIERLADLYARLERWQDHIDTLRRLIEHAAGDSSKSMTLRQISEVYEERLYHPDKAAEILEELLTLTPSDATALIDLGRLRARLERWDDALDAYRKAVSVEGKDALPVEIQADIWCRMAEVEEKLRRDEDAAFSFYEQALKLHPDNPHARQAVIRYLAGGVQWERQVSLLRLEVQQTSSRERKADLLWEIGVIARDRAGDLAHARETFEAALEHDGDLLKALRDLADVAFADADWAKAAEVYGALIDGSFTRVALETGPLPTHRLRHLEASDDPAFVTYMVRLARSLEHLQRVDEAADCYVQALRVRSANALALLGAGRLAFLAGERDVAMRHLNKLMLTHRDALDGQEFAEVSTALATIHIDAGQHDKALTLLSQTLERQPDHQIAARLSLDLAVALHRDDLSASSLARVIALTDDPDERRALLLRLGDLLVDRLDNPEGALAPYTEILTLKPDDVVAAERRLEILIRLERWDEALDASKALIAADEDALVDDPTLSEQKPWLRTFVNHLLRHGHVLFHGHDRGDDALDSYERALQADPTSFDPLVQIGLILGQRGDFEGLTARYDRFVEGLPQEGVAIRIEVLRRLGGLLKEELGAHARALEIFLELRRLAPRDIRVHDALVELHLTEALYDPEAALDALRTLLRLDDITEARLRQLLDLYRATGRLDGAGQLLRLLDFCRCTTRDEQQLVRDYRDDLGELNSGALAGDIYQRFVLPPLARGPLARLMTFIHEEAHTVLEQTLDEVGATPDDRISDRKNLNVSSIFRDVAGTVGMPDVELFLRRDDFAGVRVLMTRPRSVVIGEDVFRGLFNREQRFVLGRALELSRPAFCAVAALAPFDFMTLFEALFIMGGFGSDHPQFADERIAEGIKGWVQPLEQILDEDQQMRLMELVDECEQAFVNKRPTALDWKHAAEASAQRVGLFLSGDPLVALKRLLREEERLRSPSIRSIEDLCVAMETSRNIREVVLYLLSEDFILARRSLRGEEVAESPSLTVEISGEDLAEIIDLDFSDADLIVDITESAQSQSPPSFGGPPREAVGSLNPPAPPVDEDQGSPDDPEPLADASAEAIAEIDTSAADADVEVDGADVDSDDIVAVEEPSGAVEAPDRVDHIVDVSDGVDPADSEGHIDRVDHIVDVSAGVDPADSDGQALDGIEGEDRGVGEMLDGVGGEAIQQVEEVDEAGLGGGGEPDAEGEVLEAAGLEVEPAGSEEGAQGDAVGALPEVVDGGEGESGDPRAAAEEGQGGRLSASAEDFEVTRLLHEAPDDEPLAPRGEGIEASREWVDIPVSSGPPSLGGSGDESLAEEITSADIESSIPAPARPRVLDIIVGPRDAPRRALSVDDGDSLDISIDESEILKDEASTRSPSVVEYFDPMEDEEGEDPSDKVDGAGIEYFDPMDDEAQKKD